MITEPLKKLGRKLKIPKIKQCENTIYQNPWYTAKAVVRGKVVAIISTYPEKLDPPTKQNKIKTWQRTLRF